MMGSDGMTHVICIIYKMMRHGIIKTLPINTKMSHKLLLMNSYRIDFLLVHSPVT